MSAVLQQDAAVHIKAMLYLELLLSTGVYHGGGPPCDGVVSVIL